MLLAKERPGVYSDYEASSILWGSVDQKQAGIVAANDQGEQNRVYTIQRISDAKTTFGENSLLAALCAAALQNGAAVVKAVSAGSETVADYEAALKTLEAEGAIGAVCCGSGDAATIALLKESVMRASQNNRERIGLACFCGDTPETLAEELNCERIILFCQPPKEIPSWGSLTAAAAAGAILSGGDPAASLNGLVLQGINGLNKTFAEDEMNLLLQNGVAVLETTAGKVELIRAVTTRTTTGGAADRTFHDLNTVLIIDTVIPALRNALKALLAGARNNESTRAAIGTQAAVKLEEFRQNGIIDSYETPSVTPSQEDASVCLVEVAFTALLALNQIVIKAYITV